MFGIGIKRKYSWMLGDILYNIWYRSDVFFSFKMVFVWIGICLRIVVIEFLVGIFFSRNDKVVI